ncbi:MAG: hypothetical protein HQK60_06565 [Deltaproteobacteria bacterium]|nr:hypothetical protein [Deltaproteobacteria bacterium]
MRVAVTLFHDRVSPWFDYAPNLAVFTIEDRTVISRQDYSWSGMLVPDRTSQILAMNLDLLICGGIENRLARFLTSNGLKMVSFVSGELDEVMAVFLTDQITPHTLVCGGVCHRTGGKCCLR